MEKSYKMSLQNENFETNFLWNMQNICTFLDFRPKDLQILSQATLLILLQFFYLSKVILATCDLSKKVLRKNYEINSDENL